MYVSGKQTTYPYPNLTLTPTSHFGQNVIIIVMIYNFSHQCDSEKEESPYRVQAGSQLSFIIRPSIGLDA